MDERPADLSDSELEAQLLTLNAHLNAGEYRFLTLLSEVLKREVWAEYGVRSCAHWLNWKFGLGMTAAREKVRVAQALEKLPLIREAFRKGEVSYSKVRAVSRVAKPESDEYLLMICRHGTASHVERLVRAYRDVESPEEQARAHYARVCEWWYDDHNGLVIRARLPLAEGELVVKALEAARAAIEREARQAVHDDVEPWPGHDDMMRARAQQESDTAESNGTPGGGSDDEQWSILIGATDPVPSAEVGEAGEEEDQETRADENEAAATEANTTSGPVEQDDSAESDSPPAAGPGPDGPRRHRVDPLQRIEDEHRRFGLRIGECRETRRADALVIMAETLLEHGPIARQAGDRHEVVVHIDAQALVNTTLANPARGGRCTIGEDHALAAETARRLACDTALAAILQGPSGEIRLGSDVLDVGRRTRAVPPALRRALDARDPCCRFPGCTQTRWLDAHHIVHWANGGETKLGNLCNQCRFHHRLLHEGGFTVSGDPCQPDGLVFRRPDGLVLDARPWLTDVVPGDLAALVRGNRDRRRREEPGAEIDAHTGECLWDGVPMDMVEAVEGIVQAHGEL